MKALKAQETPTPYVRNTSRENMIISLRDIHSSSEFRGCVSYITDFECSPTSTTYIGSERLTGKVVRIRSVRV